MSESTVVTASLRHMPISFFAIVMGVAGLAIATIKLEEVLAFSHIASLVLTGLAGVIWLAVFVAYMLKLVRYQEAVVAELDHPIRLSFFPTSSIGILLISIALLEVLPLAAQVLWWLGTLGQLAFTLLILDRWLHREHFKTEHNSPAWFIPIVGNILVPVAGVELGYPEISYFFFAIGILFWLPLLGITLNRAFFFAPMPKKLLPTLFILIAPPAVGFISWLKIHDGALDDVGVILYYFAMFTVLMLVSQFKRFLGLPFALPWWAFTFPIAAATIASFAFYSVIPSFHYLVIAISLFVVLAGLVLFLLVKTTIEVVRRSLFMPE
jgi:tellurite resistance protein